MASIKREALNHLLIISLVYNVMILKNHYLSLSLLLIIIAAAACSTERKVAKRIDGIWTVTSFQGRQDSLDTDFFEFIGPLFSEAKLDFGNYDVSESEGLYEITLVDAVNGESDKDAGTYMLSEDGKTLTLIRLESADEMEVDVGKEKLFIEGMYLGSTVRIEAELR